MNATQHVETRPSPLTTTAREEGIPPLPQEEHVIRTNTLQKKKATEDQLASDPHAGKPTTWTTIRAETDPTEESTAGGPATAAVNALKKRREETSHEYK